MAEKSAEQIIRERLQSLKDRNKSGNWFTIPESGTVIRLLPNPFQPKNIPFFEMYFHYNIGGVKSIPCPKDNWGEPCPLCDLADKFKEMGGKDNWRVYNDLKSKLRGYSAIIDRSDPNKGVQLWGYSEGIYNEFMEKYVDPDWGDISDLKNGRDIGIRLLKKGTSENDGKYDKTKIDVKPSTKPLSTDKEQIKQWIESIKDYKEDESLFKRWTYDGLLEIVEKFGGVDESNSDFQMTDTSDEYADSNEDNDEDDDLLARLDSVIDDTD